MSRVRIEIWDNEDNLRSAEVEHSDSRIAYERAASMAEATLPPKESERGAAAPKLNAGSYTFEMKNVEFTDVTRQLLFADAEGRKKAQGFDVKVVADQSPRKPCGERCRDDDGPCTDTCARPQGHDDWHITADGACTWGPEGTQPKCYLVCTVDDNCWAECNKRKGHDGEHHCIKVHRSEMEEPKPEPKSSEQCTMYCDKVGPDCYNRCNRQADHDGDCWCIPEHNEEPCLNEIGAPSATRTCHQKLNHEGHCDGEQASTKETLNG